MKVLHVLNELRPSGAEVMLELAAPVWKRMGCELHILSITSVPGKFEDRLRASGWTIERLPRDGGTFDIMKRLMTSIQALRPDLVHLHPEGLSLPLCLVIHRSGIPMVRTVHNNFLFTGVLRWRKTLERWICRRLKLQHIAISPSVRDNERTCVHNATELCWNWFDSARFRVPVDLERALIREQLAIPSGQKTLVSVGNGSDVKNYQLIIESLSLLNDPKVHYYQVGYRHPEGLDEQLADQLQVRDRVTFVGPQDNIWNWLAAADVFVMPSRWEGFGLAAVEALASGCQCVFADCLGLSDFKDPGYHVIWSTLTPTDFSLAIQQSLACPFTEEQKLWNSQKARSEFDVETRAQAYHLLWLNLVTNFRNQ